MTRDWQRLYATTGWYLAAALAGAIAVQHWGTARILVADIGRWGIAAMFVAMCLTYIRMTWSRRASTMGFPVLLWGIYSIGLTGEVALRHMTRLGEAPDRWLGISFFLVAAGLWAVILSYRNRATIGLDPDDFG